MDKHLDTSPKHISAHLHITGQSQFVGDAPRPAGMLVVKSVPSTYPHAKILSIDVSEALALDGVVAAFTAADIPGDNNLGHFFDVEPLMVEEIAVYVGQPVACVVAENDRIAREAVKRVKVEYEELEPVLNLDDAIEKGTQYIPTRIIARGDIDKGFEEADFILEGEGRTGAKEHAYFETQRCWAFPEENDCVTLCSATQSTAAMQTSMAHMLGIDRKAVTIDVKRLGGAFGGKEESATLWTGLAALSCFLLKKPIEMRLTRMQDISWTGKRHPYKGVYKIGFNRDGKIIAYDVSLYSNGGALADLSIPVLERSMLFGENSYYIPNIRIRGTAYRTNQPPNTAFRGFGGPQAVYIIESALHSAARHLKMDIMEIRQKNVYAAGQTTPYDELVYDACLQEIMARVKEKSDYVNLRKETGVFNQAHKHRKRGIGVVPIKFGLSFTQNTLNQGSALVWVYADGSVSVTHGGIEMGQALNTKVAQVVSHTLGVSLGKVRVESSNTKRVGNASPTAASTGSDINGNAARIACEKIHKNLMGVAVDMFQKEGHPDVTEDDVVFEDDKVFIRSKPTVQFPFSKVTQAAHFQYVVSLGANGYYKTPGVNFNRETGKGSPFYYFVQGACLCQVEVDLLTGYQKLLKVHIVHETSKSLNKAIDLGQVAGAFFQGYGMFTMEELTVGKDGGYFENTLSTYKIPSIRELPEVFDIELFEHDCERASVLRSKGIGEPPLLYGEAAYFAIKDALESMTDYQQSIELPNPTVPSVILEAVEKLSE